MSRDQGRPRIESERGTKKTIWLLPSTIKIIDEARGDVPFSVAVRKALANIAAADPSYFGQIIQRKG